MPTIFLHLSVVLRFIYFEPFFFPLFPSLYLYILGRFHFISLFTSLLSFYVFCSY